MDLGMTDRVRPLIEQLRRMIQDEIAPLDAEFHAEVGKHPEGRFHHTARQLEILDGLKATARERGLWNFWLTDSDRGFGLSTVEYAYLAEEMGKVGIAAEVFNCNAPDTGNMEVLERYGEDWMKRRWLDPLLAGEIRSAYVMTEPDVASSDAAQLAFEARRDGDGYVLNGEKWWISGAGDPRCGLYILMACTDPYAAKHSRHTMFVLDPDTPGIEVLRRCMSLVRMMRRMAICTFALPMCACRLIMWFWGMGAGSKLRRDGLGRGESITVCAPLGRPKRRLKSCANVAWSARPLANALRIWAQTTTSSPMRGWRSKWRGCCASRRPG